MRKFGTHALATVVLIATLSAPCFCQRSPKDTMHANMLAQFCSTFLQAFAPGNDATPYKDNKELIEATRCWNYVSAVMDESSGAHWEIAPPGKDNVPVVGEWHWNASTNEVIKAYMDWFGDHPDKGGEAANVAIKDAGVEKKVYVHTGE